MGAFFILALPESKLTVEAWAADTLNKTISADRESNALVI